MDPLNSIESQPADVSGIARFALIVLSELVASLPVMVLRPAAVPAPVVVPVIVPLPVVALLPL